MRYLTLACDYDGTLASQGRVTAATVAALERLCQSGRALILVTGRELEDLRAVFPQIALFARVVAENGAVLHDPVRRETKVLAGPPPHALLEALRRRNVQPLAVGRVIVATRKPHETVVLQAIRDLGLEHQIIFNKDAVMVLPAGVSKASGLSAALAELNLLPHETVGVGDAENDHAFLSLCACAVAVQNALPSIQQQADLITPEEDGRGVEQLIEHLLANDLEDLDQR